MYIPNLQIGTVLLVPIIVAIIEAFKAAGLPSKWAPWANAVLTVIGYAAVLALQKFPSYEPTAVMIVTMLVIFLSAGGFYQVASRTVVAVRNR